MSRPDVAVIGGGVIGLAIAWRCAARGMRVKLFAPVPGAGVSAVAAGMLAPVSEAGFGEQALTGLQLESLRRWPGFVRDLAEVTDQPIGYRDEGTFVVGLTADDLRVVNRLRAYQDRLGLAAVSLSGAQLRDREPALSPRIRGGAYAPGDHQVDPRRLLGALVAAVRTVGVTVVPEAVTDVRTVDAGAVVVAAGCGCAQLEGLPAALPVRPVKGQLLRLRVPGRGTSPLTHTIRGYADAFSVYLVPRTDGELVVGATAEERTDSVVTAAAVLDLLHAATLLMPEIREYALAETCVGHRPGTPDNAPFLGELGVLTQPGSARGTRVIAATGHYRNGILLTPVTADVIAELVQTGQTPEIIADFSPHRVRRLAEGSHGADGQRAAANAGPGHHAR